MSRFVDEIKNYLTEHSEIKVVSFDIFNTILLRYVQNPEDVFEEAGKRIKLPVGVTAEDYKYIRLQTQRTLQETKKQKAGNAEVTLQEIAEHLPDWIDAKEAIEAEIEAEKELDFGNPEMLGFLTWLEKKGYELVYVSDMYLTAEQIEYILMEAGVPGHKIFVSNRFKADKKSGQLFQEVLHFPGRNERQMIHIGDSLEADILGAEKCGIKAFLYSAPYADASSGLAMEKFVLGSNWTDKNVLRHIAGEFSGSDDGEMNKWSALGAQMIGPLVTYFMDWLSEQILYKKTDMILFLMREGSFFQKAWHVYCRYYDINIENKLVFVSRQALLLPVMEQFGEKELQMVLETPQISLGEIFGILGISKWEESFNPYLHVQRKDFEKNKLKGVSLYQAVQDFLLSEESVLTVEANRKEERKKALAYFQSLDLKGRIATVDIGYQGTIQKRLEKVIPTGEEIQWYHFLLLCNGIKRLEELERNNIIGALGTYCSEDSDLMSVVNRNNRSLELLFLAGCGSTVGYAWEQGAAVPVLEKLYWPEKQRQKIESCQQGALDYLQLYLESDKKREWSRKELLQMLHRLLSSPSYSEAELLGSLVFDENNGTRYIRRICEEKDIEKIRKAGVEAWQQEADYREVQWIEGLMTLGNPACILHRGRNTRGYNESYALNLVERLLMQKTDNIYIVAAGTVGKLVAKYAGMVNISIKAFVDNNPGLQGKHINNIPVISFEECEKEGRYVIASIPYKEELKKQLAVYVGNDALVID